MVVTNDYWNGIWWELEPHDCCPPSTGILWVVSGPVSGTVSLEDHDPTLTGEETTADPLGGSPNPAGDTNGDGLDDFVVNGGAEDSYFLVLGPATSSGTIGEQEEAIRITGSEYLPLGTISGAGDIDGDGFTDLVGSFWTSGGTDWAYGAAVLMGPLAGTVLLDDDATLFREEIEDDLAGRPVAQGGDIDGDGLGDFLVSAYGAHHDGVRCGEVYLFYGADLLDPRTASSP
jgi:hypothetical protein